MWAKATHILFESHWIIWILFGFALVRGLISLLAYSPALGADSFAYFFYAERLVGMDVPGLEQLVPPLYPFLILVTYKWLGSTYVLIFVQFLMSAAIVPLYYDALKTIDPLLALLASLVILFDFQLAVVFNFTSTEPLYVFMLAVSFNLFMHVVTRHDSGSPMMVAASAGALVLLLLTRAVGRFMVIPLALVLLLRTRSWKRLAVFVGSFGLALIAYSLLSLSLFGHVEGVSSSTYMVTGIISRNKTWVSPGNGPATAEFLAIQKRCEGGQFSDISNCYLFEHGTTDGLIALMVNTALETISANLMPYAIQVWDNLNEFLKLSGQQLGFDRSTPSAAQCEVAGEQTNTYGYGWTWAWIAGNDDANYKAFRIQWDSIEKSLCPPLPDSELVRNAVNYLAFRYRSLGRPAPMLWYGTLLLLAVVIPWARRQYLTLVLAAGVFLFNHALISAALGNVQARYVVVTNPFRAILLLVLLFIGVRLIARACTRLWIRLESAMG